MNFDKLYIVVATLFVLMAIGFLCRKVGIIDNTASKKLSKLILSVGQPAMLIGSLAGAEYNEDNLHKLADIRKRIASHVCRGEYSVIGECGYRDIASCCRQPRRFVLYRVKVGSCRRSKQSGWNPES